MSYTPLFIINDRAFKDITKEFHDSAFLDVSKLNIKGWKTEDKYQLCEVLEELFRRNSVVIRSELFIFYRPEFTSQTNVLTKWLEKNRIEYYAVN